MIGSSSNNNGDGNENGKKAIGLDWRNNTSASVSRFFVHYFALVAYPTTRKCLILRFVEDMNTREQLSFSFPELQYSLLEFNSRLFPKLNEME